MVSVLVSPKLLGFGFGFGETKKKVSLDHYSMDIATNAIERHGKDDCHNVAGEIRDECQNEWGASGQSWVVSFDMNGAFSIRCSPNKSIDLRGNGVFIYAARI